MNRNQKIAIGLGGVVIVAILALGYLGFVPGLSDLMGVNKGKDLGVKYTNADYDSAIKKLNLTLTVNPPGSKETVVIQGAGDVDTTLNSAELTALVNKLAEKWMYFPLNNTQIRINSDGSVEMQGMLLIDRFDGFADAIDLSESARSQMGVYTSMIKTNPSFYMKFTLSVAEYKVQSNLSEIKIGGINVSTGDLAGLQSTFKNYIENVIDRPPRVSIRTITFGSDSVHIVGTLPTEISLSPP